MTNPIVFNMSIGKKKPSSCTQHVCPFCHPETLTDIYEKRDDMIWLKNKYPVFEDTDPTLIIETSDHNAELTTYSPDKLHEVINFGVEKWKAMEQSGRYKSVIYFRNYGPSSGGSQRHPHSQVIGLYDYDYRNNIDPENFYGPVIHEDEGCFVSLSDYPLCGMGEFNVTWKKGHPFDHFADAVQTIARYVLHDFPMECTSYNIFFYHLRRIHCKIFPRYTVSPLYMGYRIAHIWDQKTRSEVLDKLKSDKYFGGMEG